MNTRSCSCIIILLFSCCTIKAQLVVGTTRDNFQPNSVYLTDVTGKIVPGKQSAEVEGSPLLSDEWRSGKVKFRDNRRADSIQLKFNMQTNKVLFLRDNTMFEFVDDVQEFTMDTWNNGKMSTVKYNSGYPATAAQDTATFYEVLAEGTRVQLLRYTEKKITEIPVYSGPPKLQFTEATALYVYDEVTKNLEKVKTKKSSITEALPGLEKFINELCKKNKWELKSIDELKLLVQELK